MIKVSNQISSVYYVFIAGTLWSSMGLGIRLIENANVWQILLYRSVGLVIFLYLFLSIKNPQNPLVSALKSNASVYVAAIGLFVAYSGGIYSVQNTTVANAMLLFACAPFMTAILGYLFLKERVAFYTIFAITFAMVGITVMVLENIGKTSFSGGVAGVISAFGFSIFTIALRWGKGADMLPSVLLSGLLAIFLTSGICLNQNLTFILSWRDAILALGLGVFQVGLGLILYTYGSKTLPAAELTLLSLSEVLLGPFWVWLFIGEKASLLTLLGGSILLSALIFNSTMIIKDRRKKVIEEPD